MKAFLLLTACLSVMAASAQDYQQPESVDLGLSVKWASFNLGATKASEYGKYYAWGETSTKSAYGWGNYKYGDGEEFIKYYDEDGLTTMSSDDDPATVNLGSKWRTPTLEECSELVKKCTWELTTVDDISGYKVTGPNGNSIFLPMSGWFNAGQGSSGYYWTSTLAFYFVSGRYAKARSMSLQLKTPAGFNNDDRFYGYTIRPVDASSKSGATMAVPTAVDLGVSVKWASFNVGASKPSEAGLYYAWGETFNKTMDEFSWKSYFLGANADGTTMKKYNETDGLVTLQPKDDAASVNYGGSWRMPTLEEIDELREKCTWSWETVEGMNGYRITGTNGNSIFLPALGYFDKQPEAVNNTGYYWTSSLDVREGKYTQARALGINSGSSWNNNVNDRFWGYGVRAVLPVTTGITSAKSKTAVESAVYTLSGVRVNPGKLSKGIYIKDGKKFVVK